MGRVDNIMNEKQYNEGPAPADIITAKFDEFKDSSLGKYFFLYFLHLLGHLSYREENGESVFSDKQNTVKVPVPVIDSEAKYKELENINNDLEKFFEFLKQQAASPATESYSLNLLDDI
jgi:hypothetical protein